MKPDLRTLVITNTDVEEATGLPDLWNMQAAIIDLYAIYAKAPEVFQEIPYCQIAIRPSALVDVMFRKHISEQIFQKTWATRGVLNKGLHYLNHSLTRKITRFLDRLKPTPLGILLDDVDKYNHVIKEMEFVDQLAEAGNPVSIQDRRRVLDTLGQVRADLITALKTERLFRENPDFSMADFAQRDFALHLSALQSLELSGQAQEYEQFVNNALEIGLHVRAELRAWSARQ